MTELPYDELIDHALAFCWAGDAAAKRGDWQRSAEQFRKACHSLNEAARQLRRLLAEKNRCENETS